MHDPSLTGALDIWRRRWRAHMSALCVCEHGRAALLAIVKAN